GFGAQNSYVGNIPGFDFSGAGKAFSVEAWVNGQANQPVDGATIVGKGRGGNGAGGVNGWQFVLDVTGGKYRFHVESSGATADATAALGPNGTWQHLLAVYDGPNGVMKLYVNGSESGSGGP